MAGSQAGCWEGGNTPGQAGHGPRLVGTGREDRLGVRDRWVLAGSPQSSHVGPSLDRRGNRGYRRELSESQLHPDEGLSAFPEAVWHLLPGTWVRAQTPQLRGAGALGKSANLVQTFLYL